MKAAPLDARNVTPDELRRYLWILAWSGIVHVEIHNDRSATITQTP